MEIRDPERIVERLRGGGNRSRRLSRAVEHAVCRADKQHGEEAQTGKHEDGHQQAVEHRVARLAEVARGGKKRNESKTPNYRGAESPIRGSCGNRWLSNSVKSSGAQAGEGLLSFAQIVDRSSSDCQRDGNGDGG
jgi:hypothetical protein